MAVGPYPTFDTDALITLSNAGNMTINSVDQQNAFSRGAITVVNLTDVAAGDVVVNVQGKDAASGVYYDLLSSASLSGNGTSVMTVYPGVAASANIAADSPLPATWRVQAVVSSNGNITGTVGASVVQ